MREDTLTYYEGYCAALRAVREWFANPTYKPDFPASVSAKINAILTCIAENPDALMARGGTLPIEYVKSSTGKKIRYSARICADE